MSEPLVTSLPCDECGVPVFQRTGQRKRFCSRACTNRNYNRDRPPRSGRNSLESCTLTARYQSGQLFTFVGNGATKAAARQDAYAQAASLGSFIEVGFVTPRKILSDLQRRSA